MLWNQCLTSPCTPPPQKKEQMKACEGIQLQVSPRDECPRWRYTNKTIKSFVRHNPTRVSNPAMCLIVLRGFSDEREARDELRAQFNFVVQRPEQATGSARSPFSPSHPEVVKSILFLHSPRFFSIASGSEWRRRRIARAICALIVASLFVRWRGREESTFARARFAAAIKGSAAAEIIIARQTCTCNERPDKVLGRWLLRRLIAELSSNTFRAVVDVFRSSTFSGLDDSRFRGA